MFKNYINYLEIANHLGIEKGDIILISSDILNIFSKEFEKSGNIPDINLFIDTFINKVGPEGTLLFPTYNWDFCKGKDFNWEKTRGKTGSLGNACLKRKDFKRTKHAIYSFAVYGKDKDYLCSLDYRDSFGSDSIFAYLDKKHAKQIILDVNLTHCFTFVHYVEELSGQVNYRYIKNFTGKYIDENLQESTKMFSMFVRDLDLDVIVDVEPLEEILIKNKIEKKLEFSGYTISIISDLNQTRKFIMDDIMNNNSKNLCKYNGQ